MIDESQVQEILRNADKNLEDYCTMPGDLTKNDFINGYLDFLTSHLESYHGPHKNFYSSVIDIFIEKYSPEKVSRN